MFFFYIWIFLLKEHELLRFLGADFFFLLASTISFIWLLQTYRSIKDKFKYFWLILSIGVGCSFIAQGIAIYYRLFLQVDLPYPSWADGFWIMQYSVFFIALIMIRWLLENFYPMARFLFNLLIIMTVATTLSWTFLIGPNLSFSLDAIITSAVSIAYPILNLGILFASISLYFLAQNAINTTVLSLIIIGFFSQLFADSIYVFQYMQSAYVIGSNWFAPLWALSLLLIGFAGLCTQEHGNLTALQTSTKHRGNKGHLVTYFSVILLLLMFVFVHPHLTEIEIGFIVTILLVLIRQIVTLSENEKLFDDLQQLSNDLESKVEQRTAELHTALAKMERMANYDSLTGLPNRSKILATIYDCIKNYEQHHSKLAIMFLDLDHFKIVNDTMGHEAGDLLLIDVSNRLKRSVRNQDIVARQGGDEFIILLENVDHDEASQIAQQIIDEFVPPFYLKGKEFLTSPSIGISFYPTDGQSKEELIKNADIAMYQAKERGKNTYQFYGSSVKIM